MHDQMLKAPCSARPRPNDAIVEPLRENATIALYLTTMKTAGLQHQSNRMATQR
jgi:hypothetical protein